MECEQEIRDVLISEVIKKVSRIYSVQFHNIESEEIFGKIVSFKLDQGLLGPGIGSKDISISELRKMLESCSVNDELTLGAFKMIVKERLGP